MKTKIFNIICSGLIVCGFTACDSFLDEHFRHPHHYYRTIHVAGTNGRVSRKRSSGSYNRTESYVTWQMSRSLRSKC